MNNLETLRLGCAGACKCTNIIDFVSNLTQVVHLSIEWPLRYQNMSCRSLPSDVESGILNAVKGLKQLKTLRLVHICRNVDGALDIIGANLKHLEEFHLIGYRHLYQQTLFDYLKRAHELRSLYLLNSRINLSKNIYREIVRIIESRQTKLPMDVYISDSQTAHFLSSPYVKVFKVPS